jgi:hypothetical protein
VLSGLGGQKAANSVKLEQLLPFDPNKIYTESKTNATPGTLRLIKRLILSGELPISLAAVLKDELASDAE